jgi:hypothetical protein
VAEPELRPLPPEEAIRFFRAKGLAPSYAWQDVFQDEHAHKFTVAKALTRDVLEAVRAELDAALANGTTRETFIDELKPTLEKLGWWGQKRMVDPATGIEETVQLGSPRRLKLIFDVNLRSAYAAGRWERIERTKKQFPFLRYVQIQRRTARDEHKPWHGVIRPVDDPWWDQHYPPCGWNCGCIAQQLDADMMKKRGWTVTEPPPASPTRTYVNKRTGERVKIAEGIDPGFGFNVGKAYLAPLVPPPIPAATSGDAAATKAAADRFIARLDAATPRILTDSEGYPVPVGPGLVTGRNGDLRVPGPVNRLDGAASALLDPQDVAWVWRRNADGTVALVRRYVGRDGVSVELGRAGWRFDGPPGQPDVLDETLTRLTGFVDAALDRVDDVRVFTFGPPVRWPPAAGDLSGFETIVRNAEIRKVMAKHGRDDVAAALGQIPVRREDFLLIPRIRREGRQTFQDRKPPKPPAVAYELDIDGARYTLIDRIHRSARQLAMMTLYKKPV